ncbi:DUF4160 domain-containing protein [Methylobacterium sp. E-066]|uniref:DUF4160 domain-containing protein n=1 Tax=Methylobacterium sp. E-066 TaxID=2836584 RepID=UPI001FB96E0A|nr:DUF4160 domain-containing protein [Methylobacterium sp. E-066]MCJ2141284.1 DUF4160 domain-containing protein [Methylobacterium sp. E-066]
MYADDHHPPHFHIEGRGWRVLVEIETLRIRAGNARRADEALAWARDNTALLLESWNRLNRRS